MIRIAHTHADGHPRVTAPPAATAPARSSSPSATGGGSPATSAPTAPGTCRTPATGRADRPVIDRLAAALRAAGHAVEVTIDDTPRAAAAIEADRAERAAGRVARYTDLADARHASGGARLAHVRERRSHPRSANR